MGRSRLILALALVVAAAACASDPTHASLTGPGDGGVVVPDAGDDGGSGPGDPGNPGDPGDPGNPGGPGGGGPAPGDPSDLAQACGGTEPVTLDDWENCYRQRKCEWAVGCQTQSTFRDVADCVAASDTEDGGEIAAQRRERKRAIEQGRATLDVENFTQCLLRTGANRCNTALFDPACLTRFTGTVADGGSCFTSVDCASPDATCSMTECTNACCLGTCHRKFRLGETCDDFASCEPGLRCNTKKCVSGDLGTVCNDGLLSALDCDFGAFCDPTTHRCRPTLPEGSACTDILQCGGDDTCVGTSIVSSDPGACVRNSQPGDLCDDTCHGNLVCSGGTCHALPGLNEACSAQIGCAGVNAICDSGRCVLRRDIGMSCSTKQPCLPGLFCTSELGDAAPKCTPLGGTGATCADPSHCQSFRCSGDATAHGMCLAWSNTCP